MNIQEPVAYQQRARPNWKDETCWTPWEDCSKAEAEDCWNRPQVLDWLYEARALYTTPPAQRTWVGLTDEEIEKACVPLGAAMLSFTEVARAIEAKLKEKNT
jgi:pyruvate/2-oxoglutarate dehydrogenase complex dihydrolipoamide dehydrogenase (E3) component